MQWEYKVVVRSREAAVPTVALTSNAGLVTEFTPSGDVMLSMLDDIGRDEWELVGITTRASQRNSPMTTEEVWVFKRPRK